MYCIYMHKNKINGKIYIGQTSQNPPSLRWGKNGQNYKKSSYFYNAILKYGWDNFEHIILKQNLTQDQANQQEEYYIKKYNTIDERYGYNLRYGGNNFCFNDKTKEKMKQSAKNRKYYKKPQQSIAMKNKWKNKQYKEKVIKKIKEKWQDEEHKQKMTNNIRKYWQDKNHKKQRSKIQQGKNNSNSKAIQCIETNEIFPTIKEACLWINKKQGTMSLHLHGKTKSCGRHPVTNQKLHWRFV